MMGLEQATILTAHSCRCMGGEDKAPKFTACCFPAPQERSRSKVAARQSGWTLQMPVITVLNVRCR